FCAACPQLGINLPQEWEKIYDLNTVGIHYVVDGNFTAQHMKMKRPQDDIALSDCLAYMMEEKPYQNHVSSAPDNKEKSTCQNHCAVNDANTIKSNLRATGVGATACAHHSCFVLHSVVDFFKGKQHKNINYSICQALLYNSSDL
ncbi:hypothetical protein OG21DRAFT_1428852, partial [Imleria badia]